MAPAAAIRAGAGLDDPLLQTFAPSALVFQWHEDACELPAGAQLLATNDDTPVQAFRVGSRAYGVQFHFEVTTQVITTWIDNTAPGELEDVWGTTRAALLDERLFELMDEAKRRADLIRHGLWTSEWYEKPAREGYRILMPIPQTQLDANPLLVQNPGY